MKMVTPRNLSSTLEQLTYIPDGSHFRGEPVFPGEWGTPENREARRKGEFSEIRLTLSSYPLDADDWPRVGAKRVKVFQSTVIQLPVSLKDFLYHVKTLCYDMARHEADEWLRFAGERVCDPHAHERGQPTPAEGKSTQESKP